MKTNWDYCYDPTNSNDTNNTAAAVTKMSYTCSVQRIQTPKPPRGIAIKAW
jgi:hypothetical protein